MYVRCPHCQTSIEVADELLDADITCSGCGSQFTLIDQQATVTQTVEQTYRRIAHFELNHELGSGHFGSVWMARDTKLDRMVAIKIPRQESLSAREAQWFLRDARAAAQFKHPNIVSVHEVGKENETLYIVTDYIDGVNLKSWLTGKRLSQRAAARLMVKVADAVHHAHEHGVIHRDLKPGNIMMDSTGEPHVIDFGLAKRDAGEITMTVDGQPLGTPAYMPPEQAMGKGHEADARSDIYSLGVILFELLTGELPFRGDSQMLLHQIRFDEPPRPRKLNAKIPRDLETITLKCLEKDRGRRYASAAELSEDLDRYLKGMAINARPISRAELSWRWIKRNPTLAGATGLLALSLVVGTFVSVLFGIRASSNARRAEEKEREAVIQAKEAEKSRKEAEEAARLAADEQKNAERQRAEADDQRRLADNYRIRAQTYLYRFMFARAKESWGSHRDESAWDLLESCVRTARGWEHDYLSTMLANHQEADNLIGQSDAGIRCVGISPDGTTAFCGSKDGKLRVWNLTSRQLLRTVPSHKDAILSLAISPDGGRVATASLDHTARIFDASTGMEVKELEGPCPRIHCIAYSPDGSLVVGGGNDNIIRIWSATTGKIQSTLRGHRGTVTTIGFREGSPDLISGSQDGTIRIWNSTSGKCVRESNRCPSAVTCSCLSSDGKTIVSGHEDGTIKIWDSLNAKNPVAELTGHRGSAVRCLAFSKDDNRIVSGGEDQKLQIWNPDSSEPLLTLNAHQGAVCSIAFTRNGKCLISGGDDQRLRLWDAAKPQEVFLLRGSLSALFTVACSSDGRWAAGGSLQSIHVWDLQTTQEMQMIRSETKGILTGIAFRPSTATILASDSTGAVLMYDIEKGELVAESSPMAFAKSSQISPVGQRIALSRDGARAFTGDSDGLVKIWDVSGARKIVGPKRLFGHDWFISSLSLNEDGGYLASGSDDGTIMIRRTDDFRVVRRIVGLSHRGHGLALNRPGTRIAAGADDGTIKVWDVAGKKEGRALDGQTSHVGGLAFSPDGSRIVGGIDDHAVACWDVETGRTLWKLYGHSEDVTDVVYTPDGQWILSSGKDKTIRVWPAQPSQSVLDWFGRKRDAETPILDIE